MRGNGSKTIEMEMGMKDTKQAIGIEETSEKEKRKEKASTNGQVVSIMMENGKMV